jgi:hypothetical protein
MYTLKLTCSACPEQYDVLDDYGFKVGFLHLRYGYFFAEDSKGILVYEASPDGDGVFEYYERDKYLRAAVRAIKLASVSQSVEEEGLESFQYEFESH